MTALAGAIRALAPQMESLLRRLIGCESLSGREAPLVRCLADAAAEHGLDADIWESSESEVAAVAPLPRRHIPLRGRPTLVIGLPGQGPPLLFNAHSDVVPAPNPGAWRHPPFSGAVEHGRMYGRGACDTLGPLVAAFWAMAALKQAGAAPASRTLLEVVPGEEDCVGLGTLTSIARGYRAAAAVILEPTGNLPRCASRAGCRFEVVVTGRSVHGTVKWLGIDAIAGIHHIQAALAELEQRWNDRAADPLFAMYPIARPVTLDRLEGGAAGWQGMVADRASCAGYLELLPGDDLGLMQERFRDELLAAAAERGIDPSRVTLSFSEVYPGHRTDPASPVCAAALTALGSVGGAPAWPGWGAFNSGCEAGIRWKMHGTPTLVWGPGDLAHAHAADESVGLGDVRLAAEMFSVLALHGVNQA